MSTADRAIVLNAHVHAAHGASMSTSFPSDAQVHQSATKVLSVGTSAVNNVSREKCGPHTQTVRYTTTSRVGRGSSLGFPAHFSGFCTGASAQWPQGTAIQLGSSVQTTKGPGSSVLSLDNGKAQEQKEGKKGKRKGDDAGKSEGE